ncbi:uncharacterized protein DUF1311 [Aliiruegeria haliotis]|uniref:Uncharacterized protein DUF1311 n=1 Tax=Aliiruegeria haliotis TaxID=1280846 RepID=A0A2T0RZ78_9RHOB|nr:lysozyme inhibitor LprI family protein [Aliiruegeria haliotis]PRY26477.1 uncharacterized protein DUF1311 [Aliiruegeria haliotis]
MISVYLRAVLAAVGIAAIGGPVVGQSDGDMLFSPEATQSCLDRAADEPARRACIGAGANACMEGDAEGFTTIGMMSCINQELDWWDDRLNARYTALMAEEKASDAELDKLGSSAPRLAPALRAMQRAWIPYRDAACEYEQAQWGGGSGSGPAVLGCHMRMTAEQVLHLEGFLGDG